MENFTGRILNSQTLKVVSINYFKDVVSSESDDLQAKTWHISADPPFIESALLLSRATVHIFPGKKCRLCFSPFHSGTVFTRVPLLVYHYLCTTTCVPLPLTVKKFPYKPFYKNHILRLTVLETALCRLAWSHRFKS